MVYQPSCERAVAGPSFCSVRTSGRGGGAIGEDDEHDWVQIPVYSMIAGTYASMATHWSVRFARLLSKSVVENAARSRFKVLPAMFTTYRLVPLIRHTSTVAPSDERH